MSKLEKLELELKEMLKENSIKKQTKEEKYKEFDKWMDNLGKKNGYTLY